MVLVNGAEGIGTGWSTSIPNYSPRDIVANLRRLLAGEAQASNRWSPCLAHAQTHFIVVSNLLAVLTVLLRLVRELFPLRSP
jgi:hypothetical protein